MTELLARPAWNSLVVTDEGRDYIERNAYEAAEGKIEAFRKLHCIERAIRPIMGAAEVFPDEGLDYLINTTIRRGATLTAFPDPCYLGLFVNGGTVTGPTTVPARTATLNPVAGVTEAAGGGYARASIPASTWPAPVTPTTGDTGGRRSSVAAPGISFAETSGSFTDPNVQGFFMATALTAGIAIFYANFDSLTTIVVNQAGFVVRIPPYFQLNI